MVSPTSLSGKIPEISMTLAGVTRRPYRSDADCRNVIALRRSPALMRSTSCKVCKPCHESEPAVRAQVTYNPPPHPTCQSSPRINAPRPTRRSYLVRHVDLLLAADVLQTRKHRRRVQRLEPKLRTARGQGVNDATVAGYVSEGGARMSDGGKGSRARSHLT